jgi:hypothetical protein
VGNRFYLLTSVVVSDEFVAAGSGWATFPALPWLAIVWLLLVFLPALTGGAERHRAVIGVGIVASAAFAVDPAPMEDTGLSPRNSSGRSRLAGDGGSCWSSPCPAAIVVLVSRASERRRGATRIDGITGCSSSCHRCGQSRAHT